MSIDFSDTGFETQEPLVTTSLTRDDENEGSLRPKTLREYIGQEKAKGNLEVFIQAAKMRGEPLDHVLLHGPPGLGKTTLSGIIANEMGVNIRITSGPAIEKPGDLAALLTNLAENDILFVDEIHRLNRSVEEILYPAMEDFAIDIIIGKGPSANSIRLDLPRFTLIGATTRAGQLSAPLRDRFGVTLRLELYTPEELAQIVTRSAGLLDVPIESDGAMEIAHRSRGTPRIANRMLRRVRDFAQVKAGGVITRPVADQALTALEVDHLGLDAVDRRMLASIIEHYGGGPVGLETLAATINEEAITLEDVYEPYLMQMGLRALGPDRARRGLRTGAALAVGGSWVKKNPLVPILGGGVIAALVLGVMAVIVLVDAGLLHLLGVRCDSFGWLVLYVLVEAVLGLPLELFTAGLTKALVKLGWASPRLANLLYIPLDALCTVFAFWVADMLMEPVEANLLAVLVVGLLSALFSRPVKQAVRRKKTPLEGEHDQANDDRLN